jgi:hypothetical protein
MPRKQCVGPFNPKPKNKSKPISTLRIHGRKLRYTASTFWASTTVHQKPGQPCSTTDKRVSRPSGALKLGSFKKAAIRSRARRAPSVKGGPLVLVVVAAESPDRLAGSAIRAQRAVLLAAIGRVRNRSAIAAVLPPGRSRWSWGGDKRDVIPIVRLESSSKVAPFWLARPPSEQSCSDRGPYKRALYFQGWLCWRRPRARILLRSSRIRLFLSHPTLASQATSGAGVSCRRGGRRSCDGHSQVGCGGQTRR